MVVGEESRPGTIPQLDTGLPSGPRIGLPRGEFIMPGSRLPMEPSPESGPCPTEFGVEQGVVTWPVSCWDIWAIELMGSKDLGGMDWPWLCEEGVLGLRGMLMSCGPSPRFSWWGDTPPEKRPPGEGWGG